MVSCVVCLVGNSIIYYRCLFCLVLVCDLFCKVYGIIILYSTRYYLPARVVLCGLWMALDGRKKSVAELILDKEDTI